LDFNPKDPLSYIFHALAHPIRRKILRIIASYGTISFKDLMSELKIRDGSTLNYHLREMELLLDRDGSLYRLSRFGILTYKLLMEFKAKVEENIPALSSSEIVILKPEFRRLVLTYLAYALTLIIISALILPSQLKPYPLALISLVISFFIFKNCGLTYIAFKSGLIIKRETLLGVKTKSIVGEVVLIERRRSALKPLEDLVVHVKRRSSIHKVVLSNLNLDEKTLTRLEVLWRTRFSIKI